MNNSVEVPLLADPPIDDDSYRHEARAFPSDEQKQLLFTSYAFTTMISRFFETSTTLLIALSFQANLIPISFYSIVITCLSTQSEKLALSLARRFKSRLGLISLAILQQRLAILLFEIILNNFNYFSGIFVQSILLVLMSLCVVWLRASLALYQRVFRMDWLMALASTQESIRFQFNKVMHGISVVTQLLFSFLVGALCSFLGIRDFCNLLIIITMCGLVVELSLVYMLYTTCYALHLPRNTLSIEFLESNGSSDLRTVGDIWNQTPSLGSSSRPARYTSIPSSRPLSRLLKYAKRKPIPVAITFGTFLIRSSLLTIGPSFSWYSLRQGLSPFVLGLFRMAQILITLHPALAARTSFILTSIGTFSTLPFLYASLFASHQHRFWTYLVGLSILLSRTGVPMISLVSEEFVKEYLADEEILKVFKESSMCLQIYCETGIQALTLVWPRNEQLMWPMSISAVLTYVGIFIVLALIRRYWSCVR